MMDSSADLGTNILKNFYQHAKCKLRWFDLLKNYGLMPIDFVNEMTKLWLFRKMSTQS
jgi:hypothetical protein